MTELDKYPTPYIQCFHNWSKPHDGRHRQKCPAQKRCRNSRTLSRTVLGTWFHGTRFPISSLLYIFSHWTSASPRGAHHCGMRVCHVFTQLSKYLGRMMYLWTLAALRRWCIWRRMQRTDISTSYTGPVGTHNHVFFFFFPSTVSRLVITCFSDMTGLLQSPLLYNSISFSFWGKYLTEGSLSNSETAGGLESCLILVCYMCHHGVSDPGIEGLVADLIIPSNAGQQCWMMEYSFQPKIYFNSQFF